MDSQQKEISRMAMKGNYDEAGVFLGEDWSLLMCQTCCHPLGWLQLTTVHRLLCCPGVQRRTGSEG